MTYARMSLLGLAFAALAAPAMAGGAFLDLPRLTFPKPDAPVVTQACTGPVATPVCTAK